MKYRYPTFLPAIIDRLASKVKVFLYRFWTKVLCWAWGIKAGKHMLFIGPTIIRSHGGDIEIGNDSVFNSLPEFNTVGLSNRTILDTRYGGKIKIGEHCGFSAVVIASKTSIVIGDRVLMGGNVRVFDHDFHSPKATERGRGNDLQFAKTAPIDIGEDVFIGTNAIILKGTRLGPRSIVSAGSVVFGLDVPPDSHVKGNPAVIVKTPNDKQGKEICC